MNLENVFSTEERVVIIKNILYLEREFGVNEIANKSKLSKGLVSKYFNILLKEVIIKKANRKFLVDDDNTRSLKILLNIQKIDINIFKRYDFVKAVGLYGSCAKGTNTENSDVDIWIKIENGNQEDTINLTSNLLKTVDNVKILLLDDKKLDILKKEDTLFYYSLYFGSIIIYGKENEI